MSTCGGKGWNGVNLQVKISCAPPSPSLVPPHARNLDWHILPVPRLGEFPAHVFRVGTMRHTIATYGRHVGVLWFVFSCFLRSIHKITSSNYHIYDETSIRVYIANQSFLRYVVVIKSACLQISKLNAQIFPIVFVVEQFLKCRHRLILVWAFVYTVFVLWYSPNHTSIEYECPLRKRFKWHPHTLDKFPNSQHVIVF